MSWWHSYGAVLPDDDPEFPGCWAQITVGPTPYGPDDTTRDGRDVKDPRQLPDGPEVPYLASWDHEPTAEEKAALEPPDFGEEPSHVPG